MRTDTQTKPPGWHGGPGRPAAHGAGPRRARPRREDRAPGRAARSSSSPSPGRLIWGRQGMITRLAARGGLQRGRFRLRRCIENNGGHTLGASRIEGRGAAPADETVPAEPGELLLYTAPGPWTHRGRARPRGSPATSIRRRRENHSPGPCKLGDGLGAVLEGPGVAALPENPRGTPIRITDSRGDAWTATIPDDRRGKTFVGEFARCSTHMLLPSR